MRLNALIGALLTVFIWLLSSAAFGQLAGSEHIARADITVRFDKDGSLSIREELDYVKPRGVSTRGIFRELPGVVREGAITTRRNYTLTLATRNGAKENVTQQSNNGTLLWRLGQANVFLNEGVQKYVLEYKSSDDWIYRFEDLDEIRWNVWGSQGALFCLKVQVPNRSPLIVVDMAVKKMIFPLRKTGISLSSNRQKLLQLGKPRL